MCTNPSLNRWATRSAHNRPSTHSPPDGLPHIETRTIKSIMRKDSFTDARTSAPKPGGGVFVMTERLWDIYEQFCQVEMKGLDEFVRRLKAGEFGDFSRDDVIAFLREIEASMVDNIQTKALEHYRYADMADEVSEETHLMFDELIEEFERA